MIRAITEPTRKIAFISSYTPRKCGIATFTSDLIKNVGRAVPGSFEPAVIAMESQAALQYDEPVKCRIRKDVEDDYLYAADYLNRSDVDVVSVQHEFGLFGGGGGSYLGPLLKRLNKPVITTLHTVLEKPSPEYFDSLIEVCWASERVVVMNKRGLKMLAGVYGVPNRKIRLIPHGIPDLPFCDGDHHKEKLAISGRKVILTFGLLGRNKGIEVVLKALPAIVKADPSVLYIVLGATHPEVLRCEGQSYKLGLEKIVKDLGLEPNVAFHNRFVDDNELFDFLSAADIYVTPYLHEQQLTSGTLAFAVGTGKAVVSTPYWAAQELLADGRGKLVRFSDCEHTAQSIIEIIRSERLFSRMRRLAYEYGRSITWPKVGQAYRRLFEQQASLASMPLGREVDSPAWKTPVHSRQQTYQFVQAV
jgi:glycosyltransferase involved in cell wall biosynthesis